MGDQREHDQTTVHVDRGRPPSLTFAETGGEPILAYHADAGEDGPIGWVLHIEHYQPFPMDIPEFDRVVDAVAKAREQVKIPPANVHRLPGRRISLRAEWAADRNETSHFLDATLEHDGRVVFAGQNLGPAASGDGEDEYWYTVAPEDVPSLVAALGGEPGDDPIDLLAERWSGDAVERLFPTLKAAGVKASVAHYF